MRHLLVVLVVFSGGCDPIWSVGVKVKDPASRPIAGATVRLQCPDGTRFDGTEVATTDVDGVTTVSGMGLYLPGCDVLVIKPGHRTHRIPYTEICPAGRERCERVFRFDVVLEAE